MKLTTKRLQTFAVLSLVGGVAIGIQFWLTWRIWTIMGAPLQETALTAIVMAAWNMVVWLVIVMPKEAE